jgi:hypothetical protein
VHRSLKVVEKGDKEGGVKILEDLRTSGTLADEGSSGRGRPRVGPRKRSADSIAAALA